MCSYKNFMPESLVQKVHEMDWRMVYTSNSANGSWNIFRSKFVSILNDSLPWIDIDIREENIEWGTGSIEWFIKNGTD